MTQRDLFGDARENRRLEVQGLLHTALRSLARHYSEQRATVYIERVELIEPGEQITACVWLNGKRHCVINRADIEGAARDLWEQAAPGGGLR